MRKTLVTLCLCVFVFVGIYSSAAVPQTNAVIFEGARLISGAGSAPIENSAFIVENSRFTRIGKRGELRPADGAVRVDLSGKTVIPALIDAHTHIGHALIKTNRIDTETYSRENLVDHLRRLAYYGVAATLSLGIDKGDAAFQVRAQPTPDAALLRTAGRGLALPRMGPGAEYWRDISYGVTTEAEARKAVQELASKKVDIVKLWVDDRNGTFQKLPPNLYRVIIEEAHKQNLRAMAHIFNLSDAKDLLRAGIDGFAHGVRDKDIDDEFMALLKQKTIFFTPNLPDRPLTLEDLPFISESLPPGQNQRLRDQIANTRGGTSELFNLQARNLKRMNDAGTVRIGLGSDSSTSVGWTVHTEMADMVAAGMTPAQVIVAATKTSAEILKLDQLGTIAAGKSADFVVLDANPLDNIHNTRKISKVYIRGKEIDRAAMRAAWTSSAGQSADRSVNVNGLRIHYLDWGTAGKQPLIMLHGIGRVAHTFDHIAPHFKEKYHVMAVDMRGHGESDWDVKGEYLVEDYVKDIEGLVEQLHLRNIVIWGNSTGGRVAQVFAGMHPDLVAAVIAEDVGPERPREIANGITTRIRQEDEKGWASEDDLFAQLKAGNPGASEEVLRAYAHFGSKKRSDGRVIYKRDPNIGNGFVPTELWRFVRQIKSPIIYILGGRSTIVPPETQEQLKKTLPQVQIVTMPGLGHYPSEENSKYYLTIVDRFLATLR